MSEEEEVPEGTAEVEETPLPMEEEEAEAPTPKPPPPTPGGEEEIGEDEIESPVVKTDDDGGKPSDPKEVSRAKPKQEASEFPLYDSAVLNELREADARAAKAAKAIEGVREQLAEYAKKDEMTEDDIKMMQKKQEELMEKMAEFEEITKKVQHLVGLVDVASSQLGPPNKTMVPLVEGVRTVEPSKLPQVHPEDTLPKVIVCGTGDMDQVPKIIVCEPTKARDGKNPLYHQIQGSAQDPGRATSKTTLRDPAGKDAMGGGRGPPGAYPGFCEYPGGQPGGYPMGYPPGGYPGGGFPGGFPGGPGGYQCGPGGFPGGPGGYIGGPGGFQSGPGGFPSAVGGYPGSYPGVQGPGGIPGMSPGNLMLGQPAVREVLIPICPQKKTKKHKAQKNKDLSEKLDASLKMSEKLAEENTEIEGNRYELQEAVLKKDKQYDGLLLQLDSLKMELKNVVNENQNLKKIIGKGQGDQNVSSAKALCVEKKPGGLCRKDLQTMPICKAEAYKEMGLPIPGPGTQQPCPGAKFAASMGWNENQGCRSELNKSVNCTDMREGFQAGSGPGTQGSGDVRVYCPPCPNSCKPPQATVQGTCKKGDMEAVVQTMEQEVKSLQKELELVQAERRGLALQKKLLKCMADAGPLPETCTSTSVQRPAGVSDFQQSYTKPTTENLTGVELQLNSLREQYRKLQEDYNSKVEEVSMVRVEYEAAKRDALALLEKCREAEARVDDLLERLRVIELEKNKMAGSKDQMLELEQQLTLAKQRYREGQEELEEIRTTMQDQMLQLEEYRNKYLSAQQTVEEQRRQIDIMELENNRISEQVNLEIQRVKTQFQEKLQELTPLPDMLKATQLKLQECDQLRQLAERNVEQLLNQSDELKDQNKALEKELEELKKNSDSQSAEKINLKTSLTTGEKKIEEIKSENNKLRATVARLEEVALNNDRRLDEKNHEVLQLQTQLETLREESARQVSRTKDRCEAVRRTLQGQISQLECQLAQSRAAARTAQKDRDEIRQRMQAQITSLNDNFEQAQLRIRSLQSHVNYLKSSYTNIFAPDQCAPPLGPKPIDV